MCCWEWTDSLPYGRLARGGARHPRLDLLDYRHRPTLQPVRRSQLFGEAAARWFTDRTPSASS